MYPDSELRRLLDILPASGRMMTKLISQPAQKLVIDTPTPKPWMSDRPIWINFDLLEQLTQPERDLLVLRTVSWATGVTWFKPNLYQAIVVMGAIGAVIESFQADAVGVVATVALSAIAGSQIWRNNYSPQKDLDADETAIRVAQRRGYGEQEAARCLLSAIEKVAEIEGRPSLNFAELLRCQNLRAIAGISPVGVPASLRSD